MNAQAAPAPGREHWLALAVLAAGYGLVFGPTIVELQAVFWSSDRNAHGPIVMGLASVFLFTRLRSLWRDPQWRGPEPRLIGGGLLLGFAMLCYAFGRSQAVLQLEFGSLVPALFGTVLLLLGTQAVKRLWFCCFFFIFAVPLPQSFVDLITQPFKLGASTAAEWGLYTLGYPVGRSGVIIAIGGYRLLVADACAGLNSLFALESLGLLYLNMVRTESVTRNAVLAALIVPISFVSNTIRIMALALITYHFGDAAGRGFMHEFSGIVLFLCALLLIVAADGAIRSLVAMHARREAAA